MGHSSRTRWVSTWKACPGREGEGPPPRGLAALLAEAAFVSCCSQAGFALGFGMGGGSRGGVVGGAGTLRPQLAVGLQGTLLPTQRGARIAAGPGLSCPLGLSWPLSAALWLPC